jgi:phytoene dehydrogenase-like protein
VPDPPVIIALNPAEARRLLGAPGLDVETTRCALLDLGLRRRRGDPFVVSDLDGSGWLERFSAADHSLAPDGHELVQGQVGIRPDETPQEAISRLERVADASFRGWRERTVWRRQQVMDAMTGAVDLPGTTWRDRPAIARGDGVYLAGDWVAAPGLLSEVAFASAVEAAEGAVGAIQAPSMTLVSATPGG